MASVCMSQNNYQQPQHHFQIINGNMMMLPQQQQHQQPQMAAAHHMQYVNKLQPIAPAQPKVLGTSNLQNIQPAMPAAGGPIMEKKRYTYTNMPYGEQLPSVARRNARERNRVKQVNNGFSNLRQHIPQSVINALSSGGRGASKKLSKVDTLRIAVEYIRGLQELLESSENTSPNASTAAPTTSLNYDDSSNDGSNYGYSSMGSPVDNHAYHMTHSPTSSYSDSDVSVNAANSFVTPLKLEEPDHDFKFETFDGGDDDELLDYISSWQDQ
ncbi:achaete-scute complex protein T3-like [Musca vetustissima]|uniref:achaete-scute complex protein T3-like n=1 Tax=Musca vetustissima TaxID=27455 RepID=UPI002AB71528|nr:achaete-scute complex protein T3-like [Musca vetustissima]XP_061401973.1 achaete-scute complex protein T3-like [Musca vetustissima]